MKLDKLICELESSGTPQAKLDFVALCLADSDLNRSDECGEHLEKCGLNAGTIDKVVDILENGGFQGGKEAIDHSQYASKSQIESLGRTFNQKITVVQGQVKSLQERVSELEEVASRPAPLPEVCIIGEEEAK
jgi:hypothetical protein